MGDGGRNVPNFRRCFAFDHNSYFPSHVPLMFTCCKTHAVRHKSSASAGPRATSPSFVREIRTGALLFRQPPRLSRTVKRLRGQFHGELLGVSKQATSADKLTCFLATSMEPCAFTTSDASNAWSSRQLCFSECIKHLSFDTCALA